MNTLTKYWFLEGFNLFNKLGRITMMLMCEILEMENIDKGKTIKLLDDDKKRIFFLKKGTIKIIDETTKNVKYLVKKGNIFGELSLYDDNVAREETAFAMENCIICYIDSNRMAQIMEKHKSLKNSVLKVYGLRIRKLERRLQDLLYKDSATRITEFIIDYIDEYGMKKDSRITANNLLSHKDIASLTNTSRQTVSNVLSKIRRDGIINYDSKSISKPIMKLFNTNKMV